jgi:hypothetical protein
MPEHKFKIGQTVFLEHSLHLPRGAYVITKRLPERSGEFEYRIRARGPRKPIRHGTLAGHDQSGWERS